LPFLIQSGKVLKKNPGMLSVNFPRPFSTAPNVVVSPFWENQDMEVGHDETIDSITTHGFTLASKNAAPNYYVNWIAVENER